MSNASNVIWQAQRVSLAEREARNNHKAAILWLTGLPAAGKTTLSFVLEERLFSMGVLTYTLDGDNCRHGLNRDLGFSQEDRQENIRRVGEVAKLFLDSGHIVLSSFISPYRGDRQRIRDIVKQGQFIEIFVDCPLSECERRDPKGHYKRARAGEIGDFTGVSAPYEVPETPELRICTEKASVHENADTVISYLRAQGILPQG